MNRRFALSIGLGALLAGRIASAQEVTIGYQGLPYKSTGENNTGIQIADGVLLHAGIGVEAGYDTNVFYSPITPSGRRSSASCRTRDHQRDANGAGLARAELRCPRGPPVPSLRELRGLYRGLRRRLESQRGLSLNLGGAQFGLASRTSSPASRTPPTRATPASAVSRRQAGHSAQQQPGLDRRAMVSRRRSPHRNLRFTNMVNIYDDIPAHLQLRERDDQHVDAGRRLEMAPKTAIFLNISQGYVDYLNRRPRP